MQIVQRFFMWISSTFRKQKTGGKVAIGCVGILILCCLCSVPVAILSPSTSVSDGTEPSPINASGIFTEAAETVMAEMTQTKTASLEASLTDIPAPTNTFVSTATLSPTSVPSSANTPKPTSTQKESTVSKLIVPSGQLVQYKETYSHYSEVFVTKKDGSLDERPDDLEELCLDWVFYRDKIVEYTQAGNTKKADEARIAWNDINIWLDEYHENDVETMFSIIEHGGN